MSEGPAQRRFVGLCVPYLFALIADGCATLAGQSAEYWRGNFDRANEGVKTFGDVLRIHPISFIAGSLVLAAWICLLILLLPRMLAVIASLTATMGHTAGAFTWLRYNFGFSIAVCEAFFLCVALVIALCLTKWWTVDEDQPIFAMGPVARWIGIIVLSTIPIYLFLVR